MFMYVGSRQFGSKRFVGRTEDFRTSSTVTKSLRNAAVGTVLHAGRHEQASSVLFLTPDAGSSSRWIGAAEEAYYYYDMLASTSTAIIVGRIFWVKKKKKRKKSPSMLFSFPTTTRINHSLTHALTCLDYVP